MNGQNTYTQNIYVYAYMYVCMCVKLIVVILNPAYLLHETSFLADALLCLDASFVILNYE